MLLKTNLCGMKLKNPLILASGIIGVTKASLKSAADSGAGAVTIKSISRERRKGHEPPIIATEGDVMINAVGYSNPGIEEAKMEFLRLSEVGVPVIASIIGKDAGEFAWMAKNFLPGEFSAVELPLSCPHTPGYGMLAGQGTPGATLEITKVVKKQTKLPVIVKLSPNIQALGDVAKAAEKAGADAINMGNTVGPGMFIDPKARKPVLTFGFGGLSGPAIKAIAVRCVYDVYKAVKIPVIGTGGVATGTDAAEMLMAGASAVGIGSAVHYRDVAVFGKIAKELSALMKDEGFSSVKEMIGIAHE
ncbi:MAG: dihydroorotate dehydrogenase [Candidatus Aenigmatarchaeota archaeon]|nr:MAG: dihydroorotate dehydrogenase [Candidatus Aenigmarchaeota archaeon]